jgi:hypothetical protein
VITCHIDLLLIGKHSESNRTQLLPPDMPFL